MSVEYLPPDDVAAQLKVTRQVVYNWINEGRLHAVKAGRTLRVSHTAVEAFLRPVHLGEVEPEPELRVEQFTCAAQTAFTDAIAIMHAQQHPELSVEHLFLALLYETNGLTTQVFQQLGIESAHIIQAIERDLAVGPKVPDHPRAAHIVSLSARTRHLMKRAEEHANLLPDLQIDVEHLLRAISDEPGGTSAQILQAFGITSERMSAVLLTFRQPATAQHVAPTQPFQDAWEQRVEAHLVAIEAEIVSLRRELALRPS